MKIKLGKPGRKNKAHDIVIDDFDTWNLDYSLACIIHPALVRLKKLRHGYPELWEDGMCYHEYYTRQLHFDFIDEDVESQYLIDKWETILDKMIYSFEVIASERIFDEDYDEEALQEGLNLFGEHYCSLWD